MGGAAPQTAGEGVPSDSITCAPLITLSTSPGPSASPSLWHSQLPRPCLLHAAGFPPRLPSLPGCSFAQACPWLSCTPLARKAPQLPNTLLRSFLLKRHGLC